MQLRVNESLSVLQTLSDILGERRATHEALPPCVDPDMGGRDFSVYAQALQAAYEKIYRNTAHRLDLLAAGAQKARQQVHSIVRTDEQNARALGE
ncbi:hypothetical protein EML15_05780 [Corynebacterium sp. sy017]|uniref:hypothetical protein n=1 Tax=unclassified Corynebacterium TaxID=2624378 RepID=UPI001186DB3E|nr:MULTISPECIES: hypothetical protein [unclassified Corynebacterium]MBP3088657.1 hypothetical protein [Corynebacterium sp. sy017]QDZ42064.1 hypothetical protein FQV43_01900 [Corynebacterium sp. sy039]TSD91949.1 hypothetical protein ELY17_05780 [Corynebacterium sp. SY003]